MHTRLWVNKVNMVINCINGPLLQIYIRYTANFISVHYVLWHIVQPLNDFQHDFDFEMVFISILNVHSYLSLHT